MKYLFGIIIFGFIIEATAQVLHCSAPQKEINIVDKDVEIILEKCTLSDALQSIQYKSGIIFDLSLNLEAEPITAVITANNWTSAIRKLLRDYNRIEFLNSDGSLKKVRIVDRIDEPMPLPSDQSVSEEMGIDTDMDLLTDPPPPPPPPPATDAPSF